MLFFALLLMRTCCPVLIKLTTLFTYNRRRYHFYLVSEKAWKLPCRKVIGLTLWKQMTLENIQSTKLPIKSTLYYKRPSEVSIWCQMSYSFKKKRKSKTKREGILFADTENLMTKMQGLIWIFRLWVTLINDLLSILRDQNNLRLWFGWFLMQ